MKYLSLLAIAGITSAIPTPEVASSYNVIKPSARSIYQVNTGRIFLGTDNGHIFKNPAGNDLTTLITFSMPDSLKGKTCSFHFYLDKDTARLTQLPTFDLFTTSSPATATSTNNQRNLFWGRLIAELGAEAKWSPDVMPQTGANFPCPSGGDYGFELVGAGVNVDISWDLPTSGPYISYY